VFSVRGAAAPARGCSPDCESAEHKPVADPPPGDLVGRERVPAGSWRHRIAGGAGSRCDNQDFVYVDARKGGQKGREDETGFGAAGAEPPQDSDVSPPREPAEVRVDDRETRVEGRDGVRGIPHEQKVLVQDAVLWRQDLADAEDQQGHAEGTRSCCQACQGRQVPSTVQPAGFA